LYALLAVFLTIPLRVERFLFVDLDFFRFFVVRGLPLNLRIFAPQALAAFEPFFN